jgi:HPt (histidine-containing phosphotransfer) domain-containing protein
MTKPFTPHELKTKLAEYLGQVAEEVAPSETKSSPKEQSSEAVLDRDVLAMYYDGDDQYAHDMFQMFLNQYDESIDQLAAAIETKNWEDGQKLAHKMKPTFSMVGAPAIQAIFQELENSLRFKNEAQIEVNWAEAKTALQSYIPAIKAEYEKLSAAL